MRRGITLYEVVIALVIFSGSIAAISEAVSTGMRAAVQSRLKSHAILLAQSKMQEVIAGVVPRQSVAESAFNEPRLEGWKWALNVKPGPHTGVMLVEVEVSYRLSGPSIDGSFSMERLGRDPGAFLTNEAAEIANAQATALQQLQQLQQSPQPN